MPLRNGKEVEIQALNEGAERVGAAFLTPHTVSDQILSLASISSADFPLRCALRCQFTGGSAKYGVAARIASCKIPPRAQAPTRLAWHYGPSSDATPESYKFITVSRICVAREVSRNHAGSPTCDAVIFLLVTSTPLAARTRKLLHSRLQSLAPFHLACNLGAGGWRATQTVCPSSRLLVS
jgi:hypothetical protein